MFRILAVMVFAGLLFGPSALFAQSALSELPTNGEPPRAKPGESKPAPDSVVVIPGQPRRAEPVVAPQMLDADVVKQAQYVVPAPQPIAPRPPAAVVYPEPATPSVRISIKGPDIGAKGDELTYQIAVVNRSEARAHNVIARCPIPRGAKLVKAMPQPINMEAKELEWRLETLEPAERRVIEIVFKPLDDATEISVTGKVQFEHGRVVKTRIAEPKLDLKKTGPAEGIMHDAMNYKIVVSNPGKVAVSDVEVVDTLPEGLEYVRETSLGAMPVSRAGPAPNQRSWALGTLRPAETRALEYRVMPKKTGEWVSEAIVTGNGVRVSSACNTHVQEAKLALQLNGPANDKAAANQPTPYLVIVHNTGSAVLHNVRVICSFPTEMRLSKASNGGHMFRDAVQWVLPSLEPNTTKELTVSLVAPGAGMRELVVSARADHGLEQRKKLQTVFDGIPSLNWQAEGTPTAAQGQEIVYTVTVKNPGSGPAKNVKVIADLPEQVEFRQAQPAFTRGQGAVHFNPLEIPPNQTVKFRLTVIAKKAGEARFEFEMSSDGMTSGPLKHARATTISPGAEPKNIDPSRIGSAFPEKKTAPQAPAIIAVDHKSKDDASADSSKTSRASTSGQKKADEKSTNDSGQTDAQKPMPLPSDLLDPPGNSMPAVTAPPVNGPGAVPNSGEGAPVVVPPPNVPVPIPPPAADPPLTVPKP